MTFHMSINDFNMSINKFVVDFSLASVNGGGGSDGDAWYREAPWWRSGTLGGGALRWGETASHVRHQSANIHGSQYVNTE